MEVEVQGNSLLTGDLPHPVQPDDSNWQFGQYPSSYADLPQSDMCHTTQAAITQAKRVRPLASATG